MPFSRSSRVPLLFSILITAVPLVLGGCAIGNRGANPTVAPTSSLPAVAPELPQGASTLSIQTESGERTTIVVRPAGLPERAPLVIVLHGGFGTAAHARQAYGWDELAASEGFVVAYPDGLGRAWNAGGGCCGLSGERGVSDAAFIEEAVEAISARAPIDENRIFAAGMSNGGMMSYRLACDSTTFAAIGVVSGTVLGECASPAGTSLANIHGLADESVRFDGKQGTGAENIDGAAIDDVMATWRQANGCSAVAESHTPPVTLQESECADGVRVQLTTIEGAGHQWPGSTQTAGQKRAGSDKPSMAVDATQQLWEFFARS